MKAIFVYLCLVCVQLAGAGDLAFSDPANVPPPPAWAIGQSNRSPDFNVLPGFQKPPAGYGVVPFFWWLGDPLTKERLRWILGQMEGYGISGYQINYAHGYQDGGNWCGLTLPSDPKLFSKEWWNLVGWFMKESKKQGAAVSLSDYTLGFGQGWILDEILKDYPDMRGTTLEMVGGKVEGAITTQEITRADGYKEQISIVRRTVPWSINPMDPRSGTVYANKFFGQFENRFPGEGGKGLNFFFSDELTFGVGGNLWDSRFAEEFKKRKGYDIVPELPALFRDIGPRTPKVRLDFSDVKVALTEEGFFKPVYDWHQKRGMIMGCDHGGRGGDVVEFGDYFRTQRWNQGPGADQPYLGKDVFKAKVASSMAHLYQRPRVWLEGFYSSGWGTSSAGVIDATFADFVMGYNLLSFHGMYYATHGGWWEWAPPDNTFRMPYWKHMKGFTDCVKRLSYTFSQGVHACDIAIMYPVAPMEARIEGNTSVDTMRKSARALYTESIDFDFIDFQSLDRAKIVGKEIQVSGESYKILIIPEMKAIRHSTLKKALEFKKAGGTVLAIGALPEVSDRAGAGDSEVAAIVKELFPEGVVSDVVKSVKGKISVLDYVGQGYIQHRKIGQRDLYAIYNAEKGSEVSFRATGKVELWDPWTGTSRPLEVISQDPGVTKLKLPLTKTEIQLIVFSPGEPDRAPLTTNNQQLTTLEITGDWEFELQPTSDNRYGDFHWPPTKAMIGAEARQVWYCEGIKPSEAWRKVTTTFGPRFIKCSAMPDLASLTPPADGKVCEYSLRWGIEKDAGAQGYHGLKEKVHNDTIGIGVMKNDGWQPSYVAEEKDTFFWTSVIAPRDMTANIHSGLIKPTKAWLNGLEIQSKNVALKKGPNILVLQYAKEKPGHTYFVISTSVPVEPEPEIVRLPAGQQPVFKLSPLTAKWADDLGLLPFDIRANEEKPIGWYRFVSAPGLRALNIKCKGEPQVFVDDKPVKKSRDGIFKLSNPALKPVQVMIRLEQERGCYGGAALLEAIKLDCGVGAFPVGDWSQNEGLASYSGGAWYRKTINIPAAKQVSLDLGNVNSSAEVKVNGKAVAIRLSAPWQFDITKFVKPGDNRIEVLVYNTLANHYCTVPTAYRGSALSGILGPVRVIIADLSPGVPQPPKSALVKPVVTVKTLDDCNVVWNTPSKHSFGSMPLGNGDIGLNVWVDENGDLVFYISKVDAYDAGHLLPKLGRVRIRFEPKLDVNDFQQTLVLRDAAIEVKAGDVKLKVWVDANSPVIRVEGSCATPRTAVIAVESLRQLADAESALPGAGTAGVIFNDKADRLAWCYRNQSSAWAVNLASQNTPEMVAKAKDPILHRTSGCVVRAQGFVRENQSTLKTKEPVITFDCSVRILSNQPKGVKEWLAEAEQPVKSDWSAHQAYWRAFWNRSHIFVSDCGAGKFNLDQCRFTQFAQGSKAYDGHKEIDAKKNAFQMSQRYALERFCEAAAGRGTVPPPYNGSIFTMDMPPGVMGFDAPKGGGASPDGRDWADLSFMWQNTRYPFWSMATRGDYDTLRPGMQFVRDGLDICRDHCKKLLGIDGAFIMEASWWYNVGRFNWDQVPGHLVYHQLATIELPAIMCEYYEHTRERKFLDEVLLPCADEFIAYYAKRFPKRDASGKMLMEGVGCMETYQGVTNPCTEIGCLKLLLGKLLSFDIDAAHREKWSQLLAAMPDVPVRRIRGMDLLAVGDVYQSGRVDCETPEMFSVYPFRQAWLGTPGKLAMARQSFHVRNIQIDGTQDAQPVETGGWQAAPVQAAFLGLPREAARLASINFNDKFINWCENFSPDTPFPNRPHARFPAFWECKMDGTPDNDHGANSANTLQSMLLQSDGQKILLLPAWPEDWDVSFKLCANDNTSVECKYRNGRVQSLKVTPASRAADVIDFSTPKARVKNLVQVACADRNYLFKLPPMLDAQPKPGPATAVWLKKYGECLEGTKAGPWENCLFKGRTLYVFGFDGKAAATPEIAATLRSQNYLTGKTEKPVSILKVEYDRDLELLALGVPSKDSLTAGKSGTTIDFGQSQTFDRLEFTIDNPGHRRGAGKVFELQAQQADGSWKTIHRGTVYGMIYAKRFAPVTAQQVRLNVGAPVSQFDLFAKGK